MFKQILTSVLCTLLTLPGWAADNPNAQSYADINGVVSGTANGDTGTATLTTPGPITFPSQITVGGGKTINIVSGTGGSVLDGANSAPFFYMGASQNANLNFTDITFQNAQRAGHGGAIASHSGTLTFDGLTQFLNNTSAHPSNNGVGGAIRADNTDIVFNGSAVFSGNDADSSGGGTGRGGAIYTASDGDLTFGRTGQGDTLTATGNTSGSGGGFLFAAGANKTVTFNANSEFTNNMANGAGGAINAGSGVTLNFNDNAAFTGNQAAGSAGALSLSNADATFNGANTQFINNSSGEHGGAVRIYGTASKLVIGREGENDLFQASGNQAGGSGGFLHMGDPGEVVINAQAVIGGATAAEGNHAAGSGGGMYVNAGSVTFNNNATFQNNTADQLGGAIYLGNGTVTFNGPETKFINNSNGQANHGGAIRITQAGNASLTFGRAGENDKLVASSNAASGAGGFFHNGNPNANIIFNTDSVFGGATAAEGNTATSMGGVLYTSAGNVEFNNDATFQNNSAGTSGGVMYISGDARVSLNGSDYTFTANRAGTTGTGHGGALNVNGTGSLVIGKDNTGGKLTATENQASGSGGFLYNGGRDITVKSNAVFDGNESSGATTNSGGGAIFQNNGTLTFNQNATFTNNSAANLGGALFIRGGNVTFNESSSFSGNTDSTGNNDVYLAGGSLTTAGTGNHTFEGGIASASSSVSVLHQGMGLFTADLSKYAGLYRQTNAAGSSVINGNVSNVFAIEGGDSDFTGSTSGTIAHSGAGTVSFSGTGQTVGGTLTNGSNGTAELAGDNSSLTASVNNAGTLRVAGNNVTLNGAVTGGGATEITGSGVNAGTVSQSDIHITSVGELTSRADTLAASNEIFNEGSLTFTDGANANAIRNTGLLTYAGGTNFGNISGSGTFSVTGQVQNEGLINQDSLSVAAGGVLSTQGQKLTVGSGGAEISGRLNITEGHFITQGRLSLSGAGATLNLYDPTPDSGPRLVTAQLGSLSTQTGSRIHMDVYADGTNDKINVSGAAEMDGQLHVRAGVGQYNNQEYTLITAEPISGDLLTDIQSGNPSLAILESLGLRNKLYTSYKFTTDGNEIKILINGSSFSTLNQMVGLTFNQNEVSQALDALSGTATEDLADVINTLADVNLTDAQTREALGEISPYFLANVLRPRLNAQQRSALYARIHNYCPQCSNTGLWMEGNYGQDNWKSDENSIGDFKVKNGGVRFGADRFFEESGIMAGLYGAYLPADMNQNGSKADVESLGGGVYAGLLRDTWEIKGLIGATHDEYSIKRKIRHAAAELDRTAKSDFNGFTLSADLEAAYKAALSSVWTLRPYAGFGVSMSGYETFTEKDALSLNQRVKSDQLTASEARAGLALLGRTERWGWRTGAEYGYLVSGQRPEIKSTFIATDQTFKTRGAESGRSAFGLDFGADYNLTAHLNIYADAQFRVASDWDGWRGSVGLRYAFCGGEKQPSAQPEAQTPQTDLPVQTVPVVLPEPAPAPVTEPRKVAVAHYGFDRAGLTPSAQKALKKAMEEIKQNPDAKITAVGHTDSTGTLEYNQGLSERRARSAAQYLRQQGVDTQKLSVKGMGKTQPAATNATREGRAQNRRVEIYLH